MCQPGKPCNTEVKVTEMMDIISKADPRVQEVLLRATDSVVELEAKLMFADLLMTAAENVIKNLQRENESLRFQVMSEAFQNR